MNLTSEELAMFKATKNEEEWNAACDAVKQAREKQYPPDWWATMMTSGLAGEIMASWENPGSTEIKITIFK